MKTPNLLDVPKDSPTRKERLESLKRLFQIETHFSDGLSINPWLACHMPSAWNVMVSCGYKKKASLFECCAHVGRLLDEQGVVFECKTEREAVRKVCERFDLPINF